MPDRSTEFGSTAQIQDLQLPEGVPANLKDYIIADFHNGETSETDDGEWRVLHRHFEEDEKPKIILSPKAHFSKNTIHISIESENERSISEIVQGNKGYTPQGICTIRFKDGIWKSYNFGTETPMVSGLS